MGPHPLPPARRSPLAGRLLHRPGGAPRRHRLLPRPALRHRTAARAGHGPAAPPAGRVDPRGAAGRRTRTARSGPPGHRRVHGRVGLGVPQPDGDARAGPPVGLGRLRAGPRGAAGADAAFCRGGGPRTAVHGGRLAPEHGCRHGEFGVRPARSQLRGRRRLLLGPGRRARGGRPPAGGSVRSGGRRRRLPQPRAGQPGGLLPGRGPLPPGGVPALRPGGRRLRPGGGRGRRHPEAAGGRAGRR
ncbi:hypothetical protein P3T37_006600 [Kitasatospora sp. MAA4]|nr:hypothetical protein [Kitasatospora sp. MAA4]